MLSYFTDYSLCLYDIIILTQHYTVVSPLEAGLVPVRQDNSISLQFNVILGRLRFGSLRRERRREGEGGGREMT